MTQASSARVPPPQPVAVSRTRGRSWQTWLVAATLRVIFKPAIAFVFAARRAHWRWPFGLIDRAAVLLRPIRGTRIEPIAAPGVRGELVLARHVPRNRCAILYLHGGAFVACGLNTHRRLTSRLSAAAGAPVFVLDYRMAPRWPISAALADCTNAYAWLRERGHRPQDIVIGGDSAGGYLAIMTALALRDRGEPPPAGLLCWSPAVDVAVARPKVHGHQRSDPLMPVAAYNSLSRLLADIAVQERVGGSPGTVPAPLETDLAGLPPTLIQLGSDELVSADCQAFARRLGQHGVAATLELWERQVHVFPLFADVIPEGRTAIERAAAFIRSHTGDRPPNQTGATQPQQDGVDRRAHPG